jgi:hypothetical protein
MVLCDGVTVTDGCFFARASLSGSHTMDVSGQCICPYPGGAQMRVVIPVRSRRRGWLPVPSGLTTYSNVYLPWNAWVGTL